MQSLLFIVSLWINCVVYLSWASCQLFVDISEDKTKFTYNTNINLLCVDIFFLFTGLHVICTKTPKFFYILYIPHVLHTWTSILEGFLILSYKSPSHYITELLFSLIIIYLYTCILKFVVSGYLLVEVIMCGISLDIM